MNFFETDTYKAPEVLSAGQYRVRLVEIKAGQGRAYGGMAPRNTLTFLFEEENTKQVIARTVTATRHPKGKLFALIQNMAGTNLPSAEQLNDSEKFSEYLKSMIGCCFLAQLGPSKDGRYTNLISIFPLEGEE